MAPRRGGGGSSGGGGSVSSCPDAFLTTIEQASFANDVVFLVVLLGISVVFCLFRKRKVAGKKLLGLPFIGALFFLILDYICGVISTVLQQCGTTDYESYYNFRIAIIIFAYLGNYLLLVVVVYNLTSMLRRQLDHSNAIFKIVPLAIVGVMGILMCVLAGLGAYLNWSNKERFFYGFRAEDYLKIAEAFPKLQAAYYSLYLVSVLASGGLALMTILSLRRARKPGGDLIGWSIALTIVMVFHIIISIVFVAWTLEEEPDYDLETTVALNWLLNLGQALSLIFLLCIAKHVSWRDPIVADPVGFQPQYASNGNSNAQGYYYHESPEYVGNGNAVHKP